MSTTMNLEKELGPEYEEIIWDHSGFGFEEVESEKIEEQDRWHTYYSKVLKRVSDKTYWRFNWQSGSTEYQECDLGLEVVRVYPKVVTKIIYTTKEDSQ